MRRAKGIRWCGLAVAAVIVLAAGLPAQAQWQIQPVAAVQAAGPGELGPFSAPPAITFDSQDRPHVAYQPARSGNLLHTYGSAAGGAGAWAGPITLGASSSYYPAAVHLAAAGDSVYIGYSAGTYPSTWVQRAVFNGTSWQLYGSTLPNDTTISGMVVDGTGRVNWMISPSASTATGTILGYHLLRQTSPTATETVVVAPGIADGGGYFLIRPADVLRLDGDMTLDSDGDIHTVQYYDIGGSGYLFYAKGPAGGPFEVQDNLHMGWWLKTGRPSIAVDAAGKPHIVYTQLWPHYGLAYLAQDATGTWQSQTIVAGNRTGFAGTFPEILIGAGGAIHVIYANGLSGQLQHAKRINNQWQFEAIDSIGTQAEYGPQTGALAAELDSQGGIGVIYWDGNDATLEYAYLAAQP